MKTLTKTIFYLISTGFIFTRFFAYLPINNHGNSSWILFTAVLKLIVAVLLTALLSVVNITEIRINNKITKETFDRQAENISDKRKILPEVAGVQYVRCR